MNSVWFAVVLITSGPDSPAVTDHMALRRYPTEAACLADTGHRLGGLTLAGIHGRYLCMFHNEPEARLAKAPQGRF